jgi:predicted flap endonuclease-1-like 5' DNA nuclease
MSSYNIIEIEGVGAAYADKLIAAGIATSDQLLAKGATPKGRKEIEAATGIPGKLILTWVNHCDLYRVKGLGPQLSELLEAAGVDTVKELATRNAANLAAKLAEVNKESKKSGRVPVESELERMIEEAKKLPSVVTY